MRSVSKTNLNTLIMHPANRTFAGLSLIPGFNYDVAGFVWIDADARIFDIDLGNTKNRWLRS